GRTPRSRRCASTSRGRGGRGGSWSAARPSRWRRGCGRRTGGSGRDGRSRAGCGCSRPGRSPAARPACRRRPRTSRRRTRRRWWSPPPSWRAGSGRSGSGRAGRGCCRAGSGCPSRRANGTSRGSSHLARDPTGPPASPQPRVPAPAHRTHAPRMTPVPPAFRPPRRVPGAWRPAPGTRQTTGAGSSGAVRGRRPPTPGCGRRHRAASPPAGDPAAAGRRRQWGRTDVGPRRERSSAMAVPSVLNAPVSPAERAQRGRAARSRAPRSVHGWFEAAGDRPDPVDTVERQSATRLPELVPIRYGRMLESPFRFYRGAAAVMAADLGPAPNTGLAVQLCGDAHLLNFRLLASPERHLVFDINDFDETLAGPFEWDVKRLAASFVIAARANGFSTDEQDDAVRTCVRAYRRRMRDFAGMRTLDVWYAQDDVDRARELLASSMDQEARRRTDRAAARART